MIAGQPRPASAGRYGNNIYGTFGRDFETKDGRSVMVLADAAAVARADRRHRPNERFAELETRLGLDLKREADRWRARLEICELLEP